MVTGIAQELGMAEFEDLFPLHLYHIIENGSWYFKNDRFCFIDEHGNGDSFTQKGFADLIDEFDSNFTEIIDEWSRRNTGQENLVG